MIPFTCRPLLGTAEEVNLRFSIGLVLGLSMRWLPSGG